MLSHRLLVPATKEKSHGLGLACDVLRDQSLDDFGNLLLLTTRTRTPTASGLWPHASWAGPQQGIYLAHRRDHFGAMARARMAAGIDEATVTAQ